MPFGRYRGLPLTELPDSYLAWLAALLTIRPPLRGAVFAEVARRQVAGAVPPIGTAPRREVVHELVGAGLRALVLKHHPDVGGDTMAMQEINAAAEWLRQLAGGRR